MGSAKTAIIAHVGGAKSAILDCLVFSAVKCRCRVGRETSAAGLTCASPRASRATVTATVKTTSTKAKNSAVRDYCRLLA